MPRMGDIAAQDAYDVPLDQGTDVGWANRIGDVLQPFVNVAAGIGRDVPRAASWFGEQARKSPEAAQADVRNTMGGLAEQLYTLPERTMGASEMMRTEGTYNPAPAVETALTMMGGGVAGTGEKVAGPGLGAGWSSFKLPKPVEEMSSVLRPVNPAAETVINPAKLQGSLLLPLVGDRTAAAAELARVNGYAFETPVSLQGGHGYMANNPGMAWAAGKSIAPGIARVAREGAETGKPVHGVYTAMSETSPDFSTMMSGTLTEMLKHTKPTREGVQIFNDTMKAIDPSFPGVRSKKLPDYLDAAPGGVRSAFAKAMDTAEMSKHGFPSVAEARVAVTDPRLRDVPTGASGLSIAKMDPQGRLGPSGHGTYDTGIVGNYVGGLPTSVPKEVMYPDIMGALGKHADAVSAKRVAEGLKPFRPTEDYLMTRTPKGLPRFQEANQQWVDTVSQHLTDRGFTLGSGATDKKTAGAIQGIRAYHSSPHDFDKFDLSKIGTGEGAQVYGHGLYFAENPAVSGQGGQYWDQFISRFGPAESTAAKELQYHGFDRAKAAENMRSRIMYPDEALPKDVLDRQLALRREALSHLESGKPVGPRTYEVNINADPAHMLDWDKAMTQQSPLVQDYLTKGPLRGESVPTDTGRRSYERLSGGDRDMASYVSNELRAAGIPGIKYLDQGSRNVTPTIERMQRELSGYRERGNKSAVTALEQQIADAQKAQLFSNYVIFDPSKIDIRKKYGIAGATGAGGMGALAAQDNYQPEERM